MVSDKEALKELLEQLGKRIYEGTREGTDSSIAIKTGYDDRKQRNFLVLAFPAGLTEVRLEPQEAVGMANSLLDLAYSAQADDIIFDICRNHLANALGDMRPFGSDDLEALKQLLKEHHTQLMEKRVAGGFGGPGVRVGR